MEEFWAHYPSVPCQDLWAGGGAQVERQVEGDPLSNILRRQGRDLDVFFCLACQLTSLPGSKHTVVLFTAHLTPGQHHPGI